MVHSMHRQDTLDTQALQTVESTTVYGSLAAGQGLSRYQLGEEELSARTAQRLIQDELQRDGVPSMNLASFVSTYMEPEAEQLMAQNLSKNFIDVAEYPALGEIEKRCVNIIGNLFNAPKDSPDGDVLGVSTVGSSEAIILAVLAAKKRWQNMRKAAGKPYDKPNLVMNSAVQVCWEKAVRYLDVEERFWYCTKDKFVMDPKEAVDLVDENTILVCAILGTTYTGQYEDVKEMSKLLDEKNAKENLDVWIHVDAASGGFVAPFINPNLEWDFRVKRVCSINVSGHKYGLAYAGVGFALWRSKAFLPSEILFTVNYLGEDQISFTLNFSKSSVQVIGQYYSLLRFGKNGYTAIMQNLTNTADYLADEIKKIGNGNTFTLMSDNLGGKGLPLVAWRLTEEGDYDEFAIAHQLRQQGWIVPAYTMAPHAEKLKMLRVVCREDFSRDRCNNLIRDLRSAVDVLNKTPKPVLEHQKKMKDQQKGEKEEKKPKREEHPGEQKSNLQETHGKTHAVC